jgi:hypothetical protein
MDAPVMVLMFPDWINPCQSKQVEQRLLDGFQKPAGSLSSTLWWGHTI